MECLRFRKRGVFLSVGNGQGIHADQDACFVEIIFAFDVTSNTGLESEFKRV